MAYPKQQPFRTLEFYSGIGGMRYALQQSGVSAVVVEAFDINDMANDVYEHNFLHRPNQGNIQHLTVEKLDSYEADVWILSPPCQPYTRQGLKKDSGDSRALSFLMLLEMLPLMRRPPSYLFVENVVGFECSITHDCLVKALGVAAFSIQEFILTPLQFGIPYSRPRYFCLAKRKPLCFLYPQFDGQLLLEPLSAATFFSSDSSTVGMGLFSSSPLDPLDALDVQIAENHSCYSIGKYLEENLCNDMESYKVADTLIDRWGDVFDIVTKDSKRCCCFTKSYGRFIKGTGSFLTTKSAGGKDASMIPKTSSFLKELGLRYFTPREIANLHSFPKDFSFPGHITLKQRYSLLGNSLNVTVVASLLQYLFQAESISTSE